MTRQTRRDFLRTTGAAGVSLAASSLFGCEVKEETPFEGVYTDKFTYAQGEPIRVFLALQSEATVNVTLFRDDTPDTIGVGQVPVKTYRFGRTHDAGELGADFVNSKILFTDGLEPGLYGVSIEQQEMQPANRLNTYHGYTSQNDFQRFVITSASPGQRARILWVHDSLTGAAYGSFGGQSIYGDPDVKRPTVSLLRPGLGRATWEWTSLRFLRQHGYEFEYTDLVALAAQSGEALRLAYDLIVFVGQFEYVPTAALAAVKRFLGLGGNGFFASNEFAAFRVRISPTSQMTTYREYYQTEDPLYGVPGREHEVAGIGMTMSGVVRETEVIGNTMWGAMTASPGAVADSPLYIGPETSWLVEGTGLGDGDALPGAFSDWASGTPIEFAPNGKPIALPSEHTGSPPIVHVWSAYPSRFSREWWNWAGNPDYGNWPTYDGYATALYQQRPSGGQVVTLPSSYIPTIQIGSPLYQRLLLNIFARLTLR